MKDRGNAGFTLVELLIVVALICIIAAIAVPGLARARMTGNENSAIASLNVTKSAQIAYGASCGLGGYAPSYMVLGTPPPGTTDAFISPDIGRMAPILKSGYLFNLGAGMGAADGPMGCSGTGTISAWFATARPQTFGISGARHFAVNTRNVIWQNVADATPTEPFTASATVSPLQ